MDTYFCTCGWGQHRTPEAREITREEAAGHEAINDGVLGKHTIYRADGNMSVAESEFISGYKVGRASGLDAVKRVLSSLLGLK